MWSKLFSTISRADEYNWMICISMLLNLCQGNVHDTDDSYQKTSNKHPRHLLVDGYQTPSQRLLELDPVFIRTLASSSRCLLHVTIRGIPYVNIYSFVIIDQYWQRSPVSTLVTRWVLLNAVLYVCFMWCDRLVIYWRPLSTGGRLLYKTFDWLIE